MENTLLCGSIRHSCRLCNVWCNVDGMAGNDLLQVSHYRSHLAGTCLTPQCLTVLHLQSGPIPNRPTAIQASAIQALQAGWQAEHYYTSKAHLWLVSRPQSRSPHPSCPIADVPNTRHPSDSPRRRLQACGHGSESVSDVPLQVFNVYRRGIGHHLSSRRGR